jgi:hypothetical protein
VAEDNADQQARPRRQHRIVLLGVEQSRSGFYHSGWRHMMKPTFENMVLHVADRHLSVNYTAEEVERILRDNVVQLQTVDPVTEEPMLVTRLGAIDAADLQTLDGLHGIGVVAPMYGDPLAFSSRVAANQTRDVGNTLCAGGGSAQPQSGRPPSIFRVRTT